MKVTHHSFVLLFVAACSGCVPIPYHAVVRPGVNGVIVDAETTQPISGATVILAASHRFQGRQTYSQPVTVSTESAANGVFIIPPQKKWQVEPTPNLYPNEGGMDWHLTVEHIGYEPYQFSCGFRDASLFWPLPAATNLSRIYLKRLQK